MILGRGLIVLSCALISLFAGLAPTTAEAACDGLTEEAGVLCEQLCSEGCDRDGSRHECERWFRRWRELTGRNELDCAAAGRPDAFGGPAAFAVSEPLSTMRSALSQSAKDPLTAALSVRSVVQTRPLPRAEQAVDLGERDGALAAAARASLSAAQTLAIPNPSVNFEGISNEDNFAVFGLRILPPDTNGDVGPDHYVQSVNIVLQIFDKTGTPLTSAFPMSQFFSALGAPCGTRDDGDPIVLYDQLADRWLVSQFALPNGSSSPPYHQCIAISQTGDPTGAYYMYDFIAPGNNLNDYPKFGVWPDGYYMTDNQFLNGASFSGAGVFAFDRNKMLVGDPTAGFIYFNLGLSDPDIGGMLPSDVEGFSTPPLGRPNTFAYFTANEFGDPSDALRLFDFTANFDSPASSTFLERSESPVAVAAFDPITPAGRADVPQPSPGIALDAIADRLMHRLTYRNFGSLESLVVNHTVRVNVSPYQAGVRYYELQRPLPSGSFTPTEQATYAPDSNSRWMGSAAIDHQGNLAVGYSVSSSTQFPSIRYAGRLDGDPSNQLSQGEATIIAGTGVQTSTSSRWGDYSTLSVDPADDCTFWFTTEYYTAAGQALSNRGWQSRVGAFKFVSCTPSPRGELQVDVTNCTSGAPISNAAVSTDDGYFRNTDATGLATFDIMEPGSYTVSATAPSLSTDTDSVTVVDGATANLSLCLDVPPPMAPRINSGGASFTTVGGDLFVADRAFSAGSFGFIGGQSANFPNPVGGTLDDDLFNRMRGGNSFSYDFDNLANGTYQVTLFFMEPFWTTSGQRLFDVAFEGNTVLSGYDIFAAAGGSFQARTESFAVPVADGRLDIDFTAVLNAALVSAIEVIPPAFGTPTATPTSTLTPSSTPSPTSTATATATVGSPTDTPTSTPTDTPSNTATATPTASSTATSTPTSSSTSTATNTPTPGTLLERRINAGGGTFTAANGDSFTADQAFTAGSFGYVGGQSAVFGSPVGGTVDDALFNSMRGGTTFSYRFDSLPTGTYNVTLFFNEPFWTQAGQRVFDVAFEGNVVLNDYDIFVNAGGTSQARIETVVVLVTDGRLDIDFSGVVRKPLVAAIAVVSAGPAPTPTNTPSATPTPTPVVVNPVRVNAAGPNFTTSGGLFFAADQAFSSGSFGFIGGQTATFTTPISGTVDDALYQTMRGGNFTYSFDSLPSGSYTVTMFFAEPFWSSPGQRLFDVSAEGNVELNDYDIFAAAGGTFTAVSETFSVTVNDGRLDLAFVGVVRIPLVAAIAVEPN